MKSRTAAAGAVTPVVAATLMLGLSSCVEVSAPDKPIEINLNVNIKQEVLVHLQEDVRDMAKQNPDVF